MPSRLRRLDEILFDLPEGVDDEPMLLSDLDGYLIGLAIGPQPVPPAEWLPRVWGGGAVPFDDPIDARLLVDMVAARHAELLRELARGRWQPILDVDERTGDILWEIWIDGFAAAIALRPEAWQADDTAGEAMATLSRLCEIANDASDLTSPEINAMGETAPALIAEAVAAIHAARAPAGAIAPAIAQRPARVGRNDPCPCGSGAKFKRCCGAG